MTINDPKQDFKEIITSVEELNNTMFLRLGTDAILFNIEYDGTHTNVYFNGIKLYTTRADERWYNESEDRDETYLEYTIRRLHEEIKKLNWVATVSSLDKLIKSTYGTEETI